MIPLAGNPLYSFILSTVVVFMTGFALNAICNRHDVIYNHSYLPAYLYVILYSIYPEQYLLSHIQIVNFAAVLALGQLFQLYKTEYAHNIIFKAGFLLGFTCLFKIEYLAMILFLLVSILFFKNIKFREILTTLLSFVMPAYLAYGIYYVVFGVMHTNYLHIEQKNLEIGQLNPFVLYPVIMGLIFYILSQLKAFFNFFKNTIKTRRITQTMIAYTFFCIVVIIFQASDFKNDLNLLLIPMSIYIAYFYMGGKFKKWKEFSNLLLILSILASQYADFIF